MADFAINDIGRYCPNKFMGSGYKPAVVYIEYCVNNFESGNFFKKG